METGDLILVSVDDHLVEPPDVFAEHLPARWADAAPRVVRKDDGTDVWVYGDLEIPNIGINAVAGRVPEEYGIEPTSYDELRPGTYDVDARVQDMDAGGVLGSMCFPSFPGFAGRFLSAGAVEPEAALAVLQAYNDWHVDTWCAAHPGRFIPQCLVPLWDPALAAAEVRRVAAKGCHVVSFPENLEPLGFPTVYNRVWDPLWQACSEEGTVVSLHFGSSGEVGATVADAPIDVMLTLSPINVIKAATDLVWSHVLLRFPDLRVALSEGGIGWIPYFCDRIDGVYDKHRAWTGQDYAGRRPSEVFREQVIFCFIYDNPGLRLRDAVGVDRITWELDYPHSDSPWPHGPENFMEAAVRAGLSEDEIHDISHRNAMRHFRYDPFSLHDPADCTVAALRARAAHVDTTPKSFGRRESLDKKADVVMDLLGAKR